MRDAHNEVRRLWQDYQTPRGARPVKDSLIKLPDEDLAFILAEMREVQRKGPQITRHFGDLYVIEVLAQKTPYVFRIFFAEEVGRSHIILLALDTLFCKDTKRPLAKSVKRAQKRLENWRSSKK
jgi:phage-related protein